MAEENLYDLILQIFSQIATETVRLIPKILIALITVVLTFVLIKSLNFFFRKLLKITEFDKTFERLSGFSLPFSIDNLIILLADLGVALISLRAVIAVFLGERYSELVGEGLYYGARVASVVLLGIFLLAIFNTLVGRIRSETRLRSYGMFVVILLVTAMLIDITALSEPVKNALITGLSVGVGISIGVFAVWFFFQDSIDRLSRSQSSKTNNKRFGNAKHVEDDERS